MRDWTIANIQSEIQVQMKRTFLNFGLSLLITAISVFIIMTNNTLIRFLYTGSMMFIFPFILIGMIFYISANVYRLDASTLRIWIFAYSALMGVTITPYMLVYSITNVIIPAFAISISVFFAMALYGYVTSQPLYKMGSILFGAVIGLIVAMIFGMFFNTPALQLIISIVSVVIFSLYIAYDMQLLKRNTIMMIRQVNVTTQDQIMENIALITALSLYIDFINLFISIIRILGIFGGSSRD